MEDSSDASSVLADVCDVKSPIEHQLSSVNDADSVSNGISPEAMHSSDSNEVAYHSPTSPAVDQDSYSAPDVDQDSCVAPDVTSEPESESRSNFQLDLASEAEGSLQPPGDSHSELNLQPSSEFEAELHSQSAMDSQLQPTSQSARDLQSQSIQDNESALQLENAESQPLNVESNGKAAGSLEGDVISEDENFKEDNDDGELEEGEHKDDEELDFEEGEQTNSPKQVKENEDGEVESEDELEEGEVKEDDEDDPSESSAAQSNANPSVCRFYHKGLCTWGSSCRFVHNDPPNGMCRLHQNLTKRFIF